MANVSLGDIYDMVCETPAGDGLVIDMMPDFLDSDMQTNSRPHVHTFYEILWFFDGEGMHTVDFQDYEVKPAPFSSSLPDKCTTLTASHAIGASP